MPRFNLPNIDFVSVDPDEIEANILAEYNRISGQKIGPADPRRLFVKTIVYALVAVNNNIDHSAKQNLLAYALGDVLDHKGVDSNTPRLEATAATTMMRFTHNISQIQNIPKGAAVTAGDGVFFELEETLIANPENPYTDGKVRCTNVGDIGNGYLPGEINQLVQPLYWVARVENVTQSEGGSQREDDDRYAERIRQSPEKFSTAGPEEAYKYWAKTASSLIGDVSVDSPSDATVEVRPLLKNGQVPGQEILDAVADKLNDRKIRPLTDRVSVLAPAVVSYDIDVTYWIHSNESGKASFIQEEVDQSVQEYQLWQKEKLGRDIDPTELIANMKKSGAKRVIVASPIYQSLNRGEVASESNVNVVFGGFEDD
ncbi:MULTISPECIES: baseplate assembly protein [Pontibacillus]|uniref:Baseplate J/gp47 family protein n=1 Tax=Pontibacillus chungwhensis TaxID=265426 RepID=A0ABY8V1W3_9BACI|nr:MULTISPECIES: baseplate J/gp47 family protein [Pontibacillus]MCD5324785.1 baseplate J/gp47 family protein [Pontibacillus sp. HN14]WIF98744.1 baseplate J/gp47 family protein [Pontibacillus chungwhensis]